MLNKELYEYVTENELDTSDAAALLSVLQGVTVRQHIAKSVVNNFIVSGNLNLRLRAITNTPVPHEQYDAAVPGAGGLTLRLAAQAGLDWLLTDSGSEVNPDNENLQALIGLLGGAGVYSSDEVAAFWALFDSPRWPNLTLEQVNAALLYPKYEAARELYEPARATADKYEQAMLSLAAGEDVDLENL